MKIQILHSRDPDSDCYTVVFVDGAMVTDFDMEDIDPGRGYAWEDDGFGWRERVLEARERAQQDPDDAFAVAVYGALLEATDSEFITGKPHEWREQLEGRGKYFVTSLDGTVDYAGPFDTQEQADVKAEEIESADWGPAATDIKLREV